MGAHEHSVPPHSVTYTAWLLTAALLGTLVFTSGLVTMATNVPA